MFRNIGIRLLILMIIASYSILAIDQVNHDSFSKSPKKGHTAPLLLTSHSHSTRSYEHQVKQGKGSSATLDYGNGISGRVTADTDHELEEKLATAEKDSPNVSIRKIDHSRSDALTKERENQACLAEQAKVEKERNGPFNFGKESKRTDMIVHSSAKPYGAANLAAATVDLGGGIGTKVIVSSKGGKCAEHHLANEIASQSQIYHPDYDPSGHTNSNRPVEVAGIESDRQPCNQQKEGRNCEVNLPRLFAEKRIPSFFNDAGSVSNKKSIAYHYPFDLQPAEEGFKDQINNARSALALVEREGRARALNAYNNYPKSEMGFPSFKIQLDKIKLETTHTFSSPVFSASANLKKKHALQKKGDFTARKRREKNSKDKREESEEDAYSDKEETQKDEEGSDGSGNCVEDECLVQEEG